MDTSGLGRGGQAVAVAALGVPGILLAHLLTTGTVAGSGAALGVTLGVLAVAAVFPAPTRAALTAVTAVAQVLGHAVLALSTAGEPARTGCLPVVGRGARLGLDLALLRTEGSCPSGTLVPGAAAVPTAAALTAVLAALTVIAGHAVAATVTAALLTAGVRATDAVRGVRGLAGRTAMLPARSRLVLAVVRAPVRPAVGPCPTPTRAVPAPARRWYPGVIPLRGPPAPAGQVRLLAPVRLPA